MIMIIGIVIFIIVSLVLYLSKSSVKKQSQQAIKKTQGTSIEAQPVEEFVAKCLDKLAKDAVVLLGSQGGYIYKSQGGTLVDYSDADEGLFFAKYNKGGSDFKTVYGIIPPRFIHDPPIYPWEFFPYSSCTYTLGNCDNSGCSGDPCINVGQCSDNSLSGKVAYISSPPTVICTTKESEWESCGAYLKTTAACPASNKEIFEWYFGINNMPPLIPSQGPNSIQSQIEMFIDGNMPKCADFSFFENQGLEVTMNSSTTSVIIGANDISVSSKIPITISNTATGEIAQISDFSTSLNLRMKNLYYFIKNLADNDVKNILFNISDSNNVKNSFRIRIANDVISKDDLITITDDKSLVYGSPYQYTFPRRNRNPALHHIKDNILEFPKNYEIKLGDLLGATALKAQDPDEDDMEFNVTPNLPNNNPLMLPQQKFKIEVSDGILSDYQTITVNRVEG